MSELHQEQQTIIDVCSNDEIEKASGVWVPEQLKVSHCLDRLVLESRKISLMYGQNDLQ